MLYYAWKIQSNKNERPSMQYKPIGYLTRKQSREKMSEVTDFRLVQILAFRDEEDFKKSMEKIDKDYYNS